MNEKGEILKQEKFPNEREEFERIIRGIDDAKVSLKACYYGQHVYDMLEAGATKLPIRPSNQA
jgi:hypothetical protein